MPACFLLRSWEFWPCTFTSGFWGLREQKAESRDGVSFVSSFCGFHNWFLARIKELLSNLLYHKQRWGVMEDKDLNQKKMEERMRKADYDRHIFFLLRLLWLKGKSKVAKYMVTSHKQWRTGRGVFTYLLEQTNKTTNFLTSSI